MASTADIITANDSPQVAITRLRSVLPSLGRFFMRVREAETWGEARHGVCVYSTRV